MKKIACLFLAFITIKTEARTGKSFFENAFFVQDDDTLNISINSAGNVFYYDSPLAEDASNFKWITPKGIKDVLRLFGQEAKQKYHSLVVIFKSAKSKKSGDIARWYPIYMHSKMTETEKKLIRLSEETSSGKKK